MTETQILASANMFVLISALIALILVLFTLVLVLSERNDRRASNSSKRS
jgi:hypothetical protein